MTQILTTVILRFYLLPRASLRCVKPLLLIAREILRTLDVDIDFLQIIVHFLVQADVYVLRENVFVECRHLLYTIINGQIEKKKIVIWDADGNILMIYYLPKPRADQYVCAIRHSHFWEVTHVRQTRGSSSSNYK